MEKIYIRNMACESCKIFVKDALDELNLKPVKVELGQVEIKQELTEDKKKKFSKIINKVGLEIVENKGVILIEQIKNFSQEYVANEKKIKVNISEYLAEKMNKDYKYISSIFSDIELQTIVGYINNLKIEKAKELIVFDELTFTEIADKLNYGNLAAFSSAFKRATGFNPTHFKKLKEKRRKTIQELTSKNQ